MNSLAGTYIFHSIIRSVFTRKNENVDACISIMNDVCKTLLKSFVTFAAVFSLGTLRSLRPLSAESEKQIENLLRSLSKYYQYRGINLRTCCEDFDRHHIGVIQESQVHITLSHLPSKSCVQG